MKQEATPFESGFYENKQPTQVNKCHSKFINIYHIHSIVTRNFQTACTKGTFGVVYMPFVEYEVHQHTG